MPTITIKQEDAGTRLDVFLTQHMEQSRSQIQKLIKSGTITVNGQKVKTKHPLEINEEVFFPEVKQTTPKKEGPAPVLDTVYEDDDILVIEKPAGLLVHDAFKQETRPTVVDALLERYPEILEVGDDARRPGIVHRLDKDVSGLMTIAKTQAAFDHLKQQFKNRTVNKFYTALVYGQPPHPHDTITRPIARSKAKGRMVARSGEQEGKEAITKYDIAQEFEHTTLLTIQILTGRTHQIRVHMHAVGCPIVGDKLYKIKKMKINPLPLERIFLHAHKLEIQLMNGESKAFTSNLPPELEQFLKSRT